MRHFSQDRSVVSVLSDWYHAWPTVDLVFKTMKINKRRLTLVFSMEKEVVVSSNGLYKNVPAPYGREILYSINLVRNQTLYSI